MLRADLIEKLETVKPALAANQVSPLLTQFWFTGRQLMATNSHVSIAIPFETEFKGAVSAKLLDLLKVMGGGVEVEVTNDGPNNIVVQHFNKTKTGLKPGKGQIRLAMQELDPQLIFKVPSSEDGPLSKATIKELMDGVEHCLLSVGGADTASTEYLGITFEKDPDNERRIVLYSTDSATICRAYVRSTNTLQIPKRSIVPTLFCEQMLRLYRAASKNDRVTFRIAAIKIREGVTDRFAHFTVGSAVLLGRLLDTQTPLNFTNVLEYHLPKQFEKALVEFPPRLRGALERASIVCDAQRNSTKIEVRRGSLTLHSVSDHEEVKDELQFADHDDISVSVEPRFLRRASNFDKCELLISRHCVIVSRRDGGLLYLVSYH